MLPILTDKALSADDFSKSISDAETSFSFLCDANGCPLPSTCDSSGRRCNCPSGYFAWGKSCVSQRFNTTQLCEYSKCSRFHTQRGYCTEDRTCQCTERAVHTSDLDFCQITSRSYHCKNGSACAGQGVCGRHHLHPDQMECYCKPGFVFATDRWTLPFLVCIPGSMASSSEACGTAGAACPNGVCLSATGDYKDNLRCYCTYGKKRGKCVPQAKRHHALAHAEDHSRHRVVDFARTHHGMKHHALQNVKGHANVKDQMTDNAIAHAKDHSMHRSNAHGSLTTRRFSAHA
nr:hypothetical protein BaRGS_026690 [Batillaria attramentaria]